MLKVNENCKVTGIYKRLVKEPAKTSKFIIALKIKQNDDKIKKQYITICKTDLGEQLNLLMNKQIGRIYATNDMEDIDIFFDNMKNKYCIECSPVDGKYEQFYFEKENFEKELINMFGN